MCYATGTIPCSDACDEAGRCLLSSDGESDELVVCAGHDSDSSCDVSLDVASGRATGEGR